MIQISRLSKSFGPRQLFDEATIEIKPDERIGLIGPNGAGKTTLLRMLCGEEEIDGGAIIIPETLTVGYLRQDVTIDASKSLLEATMQGFPQVAVLERTLIELEMQITQNPHDAALLKKYGKLREDFEQMDGYLLENRAKTILSGVGFAEKDYKRPMQNLSGGWMMRVVLARLLLQQPALLLMDEPTNHLDLQSIIWLEKFIKNYTGTVIIISHDQYFLNRTVTQIVEISGKKLVAYSGNYDFYVKEKALRQEQIAAEYKNQQRFIEKNEQFIERFRYKASKAKQVQSRVKMLERLERIEQDDERKTLHFNLPPSIRSGKIVAQIKNVKKQYGELTVYDALNFEVMRGDKIGLVGHNGAGKSTLLKILAGHTEIQSGEVRLGQNVTAYYYAQHQLEILQSTNTILQEIAGAAPNLSEQQVRTLAGMFMFSSDEVLKQISILSGGEKARVALAKMLANPANFLILDEPTNHLDLAARRVLQRALENYDGTIVFITHDREFLNGLASTIVEIDNGKLRHFAGDYAYYLWKIAEGNEQDSAYTAAAVAVVKNEQNKKSDRQRRALILQEKQRRIGPIKTALAALENEIASQENLQESLTAELCQPEVIANVQLLTAKTRRLKEVEKQLAADYERWESLSADLENQTRILEQEFGSP